MNSHDDLFPYERKKPYSEITRKVVPVHSRILTKKEYMEGLMLRRKMRGKVDYR